MWTYQALVLCNAIHPALNEVHGARLHDVTPAPRHTASVICHLAFSASSRLSLMFTLLFTLQAEEKFNLMWPDCTVSWVKGYRKDFFGQVRLARLGSSCCALLHASSALLHAPSKKLL
jgi:hypothetical protein